MTKRKLAFCTNLFTAEVSYVKSGKNMIKRSCISYTVALLFNPLKAQLQLMRKPPAFPGVGSRARAFLLSLK